MKLFIMTISLMILGCVQPVAFKEVENKIDPAFQPYVHGWQLNYVGDWPPGLKVQFGEPFNHEKTIGDCRTQSYNGKSFQYTINIEKKDWDTLNKFQREFLIFHELGHCVALKEHTDTLEELSIDEETKECPKSYMHPKMQSEALIEFCREKLYRELFEYSEADTIFWPNYKLREPNMILITRSFYSWIKDLF